MGCHFLLQGIFPTQGSNPCFCIDGWILYWRVTRESLEISRGVLVGKVLGTNQDTCKRWPGGHCGLTDPDIGPEKSKCDFPTLHPQKFCLDKNGNICGYLYHRAYISYTILSSSNVFKLREQLKWCLLLLWEWILHSFRRDKKDCMRKSKYITGVI